MLVTQLVDDIVAALNLSPEKWGDGTLAIATMDYVTCLSKTQLQVLVVPDLVTYNFEAPASRRRINNVSTLKSISIMVGKSFVGLALNDDVAPWAETKGLMNIRERICQFLIATPIPGLALVGIEETPVDELALDERNFIAISTFNYDTVQCGSGPDLQSS